VLARGIKNAILTASAAIANAVQGNAGNSCFRKFFSLSEIQGGAGCKDQSRLFMFYLRACTAEILNRRFNAKQCLTGQPI
jgi:hypothetical protein